jgi:hypothetical protein
VKAAVSVFGAIATLGAQALAGLAGEVLLGACASC